MILHFLLDVSKNHIGCKANTRHFLSVLQIPKTHPLSDLILSRGNGVSKPTTRGHKKAGSAATLPARVKRGEKMKQHFSKEFPDDLVVVLDGAPPTTARMVNWKDGTSRTVKVIPGSMWADYFNRRIGHPKPLKGGELRYITGRGTRKDS